MNFSFQVYIFILFCFNKIKKAFFKKTNGDWGLGIGDWGVGVWGFGA